MPCVVLIGFMGAGKTTVGRALAGRLGWKFLDLDDLIEQREQRTVAEIFASSGEAAFRGMESAALSAALQDCAGAGDLVLALGGGAFAQKANRDALAAAGLITVLLEAPVEELRRRCTTERKVRPLAAEQARFNELFAARRADYALARHRVQTAGKPVALVTAEIEKLLKAVVGSFRN
ncbi:MAG TPA: shikimate kinase [Candidatus Angelobacter sp.]|jgi:shikimate kinase|nr:shikimate kinase [Candidatus Angelobacter sp.]